MLMITPEARRLLQLGGWRADPWLGREKVTLAGSAHKGKQRQLKREKFERLLGVAIKVLKAWRASKFEYEAACRNGLRAGLCLEGWHWKDADRVAADLVETGLRRIGAVRPPWNEGQIDFAMETPVDREHCLHCAGPIPDDRRSYAEARGRSVKYCGDPCMISAGQKRRRIAGEKAGMAEYLAACAVKSQRTFDDLARNCNTCGTLYFNPNRGTKYCSFECRVEAITVRGEVDCEACGVRFTQGRPGVRFCSKSCAARTNRAKRAARFQCEEIT